MNYEQFAAFLEKRLHVDEKKSLLQKLADSPDRFVGDFRASKPITKLNQFVTQSREIKFGDAIEEAIEVLLTDCMDCENINKKIKTLEGENLNLDQYFKRNNSYYFVEQKVRDDHDSTKKRGQMENFKKKYEVLKEKHGDIVGIIYFIDPSLKKNKNYYKKEIDSMAKFYQTEGIYLFYGQEFFEHLENPSTWEDFVGWLRRYREEMPDVASFNYDKEPQSTFNEIITLETKWWKKIINDERLWKVGIINELFKTGETLKMLQKHFLANKKTQIEAKELEDRMKRYYPNF